MPRHGSSRSWPHAMTLRGRRQLWIVRTLPFESGITTSVYQGSRQKKMLRDSPPSVPNASSLS